MGLVGIEAVFAAMKTKLQTDLPAKVAALNGVYADAYVLTDVPATSYYNYIPDLAGAAFEFPAIVLLEEPSKADAAQSGPALQVVRYSVVADVLVRGDDAANLTYLLWRYDRAIKEILVQRHSLAPTCTTCVWDETSNHRITDPDSGDLLQDRASRFLITTAEATT